MKKIYMVMVEIDFEYKPICAFTSRTEAERYIVNSDDDSRYRITEFDLYDGYLEYSMNNYR